MKVKKSITVFVLGIFGIFHAQNTPTPPKTPQVNTIINQSSSASHTVTTVSNDGDEIYNSSISVKETDAHFKIRAHFNVKLYPKLKATLMSHLITSEHSNSGSIDNWKLKVNSKTVLECTLKLGYLRLFTAKEDVSYQFFQNIKQLSENIKAILSGRQSKSTPKSDLSSNTYKLAKKRLENARKKLEAAQQELKQAKQDIQVVKQN